MGLFDNKEERQKKKDEQAAKDKKLQERLFEIKVTTGDIKKEYEVDRLVFNIGASSTGMLSFIGPSPDKAFRDAEAQLKIQALRLNCDAVIHTQFEHRITLDKGLITDSQGVEVFAYGTAIKFI